MISLVNLPVGRQVKNPDLIGDAFKIISRETKTTVNLTLHVSGTA